MATNPMKRRERNSFLIGFIIALAFMALIVFIVFKQYSEKKDELEQLRAQQVQVLVAADKIESGATLSDEDFTVATVMTDMMPDDYYTNTVSLLGDPTQYIDENGEPVEDEENGQYGMAARIEIPAGTIVTKNMFMRTEEVLTDDMRIQEYSSIVLPSQLKNGDFIDIRLAMPNGQDYIVLTKKEVIQTDETTVWFRVNEAEIILLNSAMVDAWTITGTKLYAIEYVDPGMQLASSITYQPSAETADFINSNPNITKDAYNALANNLSASRENGGKKMSEYREYIDNMLSEYIEDRPESVEAGFSEEITNIQTHRQDYVDALEGTGLIGNDEIPSSSQAQ